MPAWWTTLWPLLYYFIGCYIKEYPIKLSWIWNLVLLGALLISLVANVLYGVLAKCVEKLWAVCGKKQ